MSKIQDSLENQNIGEQKIEVGHSIPIAHPIATAIETYVHAAQDIKFALRTLMPVAREVEIKRQTKVVKLFEKADELITSHDAEKNAHGIKLALEAMRMAARSKYSSFTQIIEQSLFLSLFTAFEAYTGNLLKAIYKSKPELFDSINRSIPLKDVLAAPSIDELKLALIDEEVESFRRKSYPEQFEFLGNQHKISLKKFDNWFLFVEASQRRNLFTHCGGVVSEQYRSVCKKEGVPNSQIAPVGTVLELTSKYLFETCELMMEVALKLGQTLWRKILPEEIKEADEHLHNAVYDALCFQQWPRAETFGKFFADQAKFSSDLKHRMAIINLAIALKNLKKNDELKKLLGEHDWSATLPEFHLAEAVLLLNFENAVSIMKDIGPSGKILSQQGYHSWPLFNDFREEPIFLQTYEEIFGCPFFKKVQESAAQISKELVENNDEKKSLDSNLKNP